MYDVPDTERLLVLYDADCGICSQTARLLRRLDRRGVLRLLAAQLADDIPGVPGIDARLQALQVRDPLGQWASGGAAAIAIAEVVAALRPLAIAARLPGGRVAIEWAYAVVASNRHRISRALGVDACPVDSTEFSR